MLVLYDLLPSASCITSIATILRVLCEAVAIICFNFHVLVISSQSGFLSMRTGLSPWVADRHGACWFGSVRYHSQLHIRFYYSCGSLLFVLNSAAPIFQMWHGTQDIISDMTEVVLLSWLGFLLEQLLVEGQDTLYFAAWCSRS